ncbi:hypothetical protein AIE71_21770 [Salmonella enterica subsp. enterica]|nr:hypothetical protein [Salmonella enterica subsp. enterica]EEA7994181.1 hypothetical protein [Salmonella enterica subsp. enterica]
MKKYCLTKSTQSRNVRWQTENDWYWHCKKQQIPYICLEQRVSLTDIRWDYITYRADTDDVFDNLQGKKLISETVEVFSTLMKEAGNTRARCNATGWTAALYDVPNNIADRLAKELFDLISQHYSDYLMAVSITKKSL